MPDHEPANQPGESQRSSPALSLLRDAYRWILSQAERFVAGPRWQSKVLLFSIGFSIFFSGGIDYRALSDGPETTNNNGYAYGFSEGYFLKMENPWLDLTKDFRTSSHNAKLNFRLTVPVILHYLGIRAHWVLPALTVAAICAILIFVCEFAFQVTSDRITSFFATLGIASTFTGSFGFIAYYDAIALAQLALALMPRISPVIKGLLVFTASFTDERAFVASALLLVPELCLPLKYEGRSKWLRPGVIAVLVGMGAYVIGRLCLMKFAGLTSTTMGVTFYNMLCQLDLMQLGVWYALEGGWLLVGLALLLLWRRKQWAAGAVLILTILASLTGSFMVTDILRSSAYVFPAVMIALRILAQEESIPSLRLFTFIAFAISALGGNYNIFCGQVFWFMPVSVKLIEILSRELFLQR